MNCGRFENLSPLQQWAIPAMSFQQNVLILGSSKTGKTLGYVISVIDVVKKKCAEEVECLYFRKEILSNFSYFINQFRCRNLLEMVLLQLLFVRVLEFVNSYIQFSTPFLGNLIKILLRIILIYPS